jgi:hypothetical protein
MPWPGWDSPTDFDSGGERIRVGRFRYTRNSPEVSDAAIDSILKSGKNPKRVLGAKIKGMSPGDAKKVQDRIKAREDKRSQGKGDKGGKK